ncbi:MAG: RNA-binding protein [Hyphomicrobiaceae bacterium]
MRSGKKQHRGATARATPGDANAPGQTCTSARRCAVSGETKPKDQLIRFVPGPDGIVPDIAARLPGRGIWVSNNRNDVARAVKIKAFARSLKQQVDCPAELPDLVERLLRRRVVNLISLANKAGHAVAGFSRVESTLRDGSSAALLHASDAAADGCRKLNGLANAGEEIFGSKPEIVTLFTSDELSLAFGRSNVVHAALKQGGVSASFLKELERLRNYAADTGLVDGSTAGAATPDSRCTETV